MKTVSILRTEILDTQILYPNRDSKPVMVRFKDHGRSTEYAVLFTPEQIQQIAKAMGGRVLDSFGQPIGADHLVTLRNRSVAIGSCG